MASLFTVGHGARTLDDLIALLGIAGVDLVVDVRRFPGSRRHPHFSRESLGRELPTHGISYEWWGEELGGRRKVAERSRHLAWRVEAFRAYADHMESDEFQDALDRLIVTAKSAVPGVMCAETLWWRCHRRLIADALVARGHEVFHLVQQGSTQTHTLNEAARLDEAGLVVYDVGVDRQLDI